VILEVKVKPRSSQERIVETAKGPWTVYLRAVPAKGKANEALIAMLAERFSVPKSAIRILLGESSKLKRLEIIGR
jgi:uncharacterized protein YggU (UPF0235/DUF167 family)